MKVLFGNYIGIWGKVLTFDFVDPLKGSQRPQFEKFNLEQ